MKPDLGRIVAQAMTQPAEGRTIETITDEILDAKRAGGEAILTIGRCLIEAKGMLSHGEWLPWLNEQVELSERTAQKFMKLAREWSNPNTLADLGASKALMLLALPAEERDGFMEENNVIDMSARQLEQAIKDRDEARKAAEEAKVDAATAEQARAKMAEDMAMTKATLRAVLEEKQRTVQDVDRLQQELEELKAKPVEVAVEPVVDPEVIEKARAEAVAEIKEKLKIARSQRREAQDALAAVQAQLDRIQKEEKRAAISADKDLAQFEVLFNQGQELANKLRGLLLKARGREDQSAAQGMEKALRALAEAIGRCAG